MAKSTVQLLGIDFDNTLVDYDDLIHLVSLERGLVDSTQAQGKKEIRDAIRKLDNGEIHWQKVQALVYGPRMPEAIISFGAKDFLRECVRNQVKVNVVSHKTTFANYDETGTNLQDAALEWLEANGLFHTKEYGLTHSDVYFEPTRQQKLDRILQLRCSHFIDDLEETFLEASFPESTQRILYSPQKLESSNPEIKLVGNWPLITEYLFND